MLLKDLLELQRIKFINTWTSISKNVYINKLDDIMNEHNNTYHKTIKLKPADVNPSIYLDLNKENNNKGSKFKVGDNNRTSKYKIIFAKVKLPN